MSDNDFDRSDFYSFEHLLTDEERCLLACGAQIHDDRCGAGSA